MATANNYCGFVPGGSPLPLDGGPTGDDTFFVNSPNADEISALIEQYRNTAVYDAASGIDRGLLNQNTSDLNTWISTEIDRINNVVEGLANNSIANTNNSSGFPGNIDDLKDIGAVYNAKDTERALGLRQPTKPNKKPFGNLYPDLDDRLSLTPFVTTAETSYFIRTYNFDARTFGGQLQPGNIGLLTALNSFYGHGNFASSSVGSFCALIPDIFAAVNGAIDMFNDIAGYAGQFKEFLADPLGFAYKLSEQAAKQLIEKLKDQVLTVVDQLAQEAMDKIKNITGGWVDPQYLFNHGALSEKFIREKEKVMNFFSKENIEGIKKKIEGAISYAAGVFERMDLEEIQFLIMKFCELISQLQAIFFGRSQVLTDYMSAYSMARQTLSGAGNVATARAVRAGAIRYDPETRYAIQTRTSGLAASGPVSSSPNAPPGAQVPEGARGVPANVEPISPEEMAQVPSYEEIMSGHPHLAFSSGLGGMRAAGWTGAQTTEKVMLIRLAKVMGKKLYINSAYRSPSYNASVGGASKSIHMSGKAFDIALNHGLSAQEFINTARSIGFSGFGTYNSFVHIDTGPARTWRG